MSYEIQSNKLIKVTGDGSDVFKVPDSVRIIGESAFKGTNFKRVILPKSVTKIEDFAFDSCKNLEEINLRNIYEFGKGAFYCCGLKSVEVRAPIISQSLFWNCGNLSRAELYGTREIKRWAFFHTNNLVNLELPQTLVKIGDHAFSASGARHIKVPKNVRSIEKYAFSDCFHINVYKSTSSRNLWGGKSPFIASVLDDNEPDNNDLREDFYIYSKRYEQIAKCVDDCGVFHSERYDEIIFRSDDIDEEDIHDRVIAMLMRLPGIYNLHYPEFREHYSAFLAYFDVHKPASAKALLDFDKEKFLRLLELAVDEKTFPELLNYAIEKGNPEITAEILKYKNEHFPNLTDKFDLK